MNILFLHPNMPGQYRHLARILGASGQHRIYFITKHKSAQIPGVTRVTYAMPEHTHPPSHPYLGNAETAIRQGQTVWRVARQVQVEKQFTPDVIVCHPGWGDALFMKDLFPHARMLSFCEFFYRAHGADVGFERGESTAPDDEARVRIKNTINLLNLEMMDWGITPTVWQWSVHPEPFRSRISVLHDGVDVDTCRPNPAARITLSNGLSFGYGDELITYIARNFEPYRGFHTFMHAAERILKARPNAHIIAIGSDDVSYGKRASDDGRTYRQILNAQVNLPADRIHFPGPLPYAQLIQVLQVSAAHLYLTYPFVLSWSMLESMACGVAMVASRTQPVQEIIRDGENALLADFHSPDDVAEKMIRLLEAKDQNAAMRQAARDTIVRRFALKDVMPLQVRLVEEIGRGEIPPPVNEEIKRFSQIAPYTDIMWRDPRS